MLFLNVYKINVKTYHTNENINKKNWMLRSPDQKTENWNQTENK